MSRGRSLSGVALAPSAGRAEGALLTVVLYGSRLERRADGPSWEFRAATHSLRRPADTAVYADRSRADAAVARQGLRAAGGAQARNLARKPCHRRAAQCRAWELARLARRLPRPSASLATARSARPLKSYRYCSPIRGTLAQGRLCGGRGEITARTCRREFPGCVTSVVGVPLRRLFGPSCWQAALQVEE